MNNIVVYVMVNFNDNDVTFINSKEEVNEQLAFETVDPYYGSPAIEIYSVDEKGRTENVEINYSMKI